jgi:peptidoglycan/LPS O-acetylase OafA/YrhL
MNARVESDASARRGKIVSIQYLRGFAAVGVVVYHSCFDAGLGGNWPVPVFGAGVDVFFAISGFVMWTTTFGTGIRPRMFVRKRVERIVPLYWLMTAIALAVSVLSPHLKHEGLGGDTSIGYSLTSFAFLPATNSATHVIQPIVSPGWTLNYEMFFYAIFAAGLLLPSTRRLAAVLGTIGAIALVGTAVNSPTVAAFYGNSIILEFAFGILIGVAYTRGVSAGRLLCGGLVALSLIALIAAGPNSGIPRVLTFGIPGAAVVLAAAIAENRRPVRFSPLLHKLGDASYSVYIVHGMCLAALLVVVKHLGLPRPVMLFVGPVSGILFGLLVYHYAELPIRHRLTQRRATKASAAPVSDGTSTSGRERQSVADADVALPQAAG